MKTFLSIILALMLIGGLVWLTSDPKESGTGERSTNCADYRQGRLLAATNGRESKPANDHKSHDEWIV